MKRPSSNPRFRHFALTLLKLCVTGGLVYWLMSNADYVQIEAALTRVGPIFFIGAVLVNIGTFFLTATRWWLLLGHTGEKVGLAHVLPSYYLGLFFNNLLPTGIGGDVVRAIHLRRRGLSIKALAASTIVDRGIGLLVMLLVATACAVWVPQIPLDDNVRKTALVVFTACLGATTLAFSPWAGALLKRLQKYFHNTKLRRGVLDSIWLCYSYRSNTALLLLAAVLSLMAQSLAIFAYILLGHSLGLDLSPATYFVVVPIVFMAAMLPISLGGLGVREGTLVGLLILLGADRQLAISLSLLYLFTLWLSTLPGALVLLARDKARLAVLSPPT